MHTKTKGALGEAVTTCHLISKNYPVFTEIGDLSKVDLVALVGYTPIRIQTKALTSINGTVPLKTSKSGPGYRFKYNERDFDIMSVYVLDEDILCFVSAKRLFETGNLTLRTRPSRNNQAVNCHFTKDFLSFEDALRDYTPNSLAIPVAGDDIVQTTSAFGVVSES